jgi:hypothetical protein
MRIRSARRKGLPNKQTTQEHYVRCDNTGLRVLSGDVRKQWDGLLVWKGQFDERHPQEFVRGVVDNFAVRDARPEAPMSVVLATGSEIDEQSTGAFIELLRLDIGSVKYASFLQFTISAFALTVPVVLTGDPDTLLTQDSVVLTFGEDDVTSASIVAFLVRNLVIEHSFDAVTWTASNDTLTQLILQQTQLGIQSQVPISKPARYVRIALRLPRLETVRYTISATLLGGSNS